jgi:Fe-S cluster assembly protein SufD
VTVAIQNVDRYVESFTEFERLAAGRELPWLRKMREEAFARFCEVGFPTTHDEDWRFTNVSAIARTRFSAPQGGRDHVSDADLGRWRMEGAAAQLVFVDGRFVPQLSSLEMLPTSVTVSSLRQELAAESEVLAAHFGRYLNVRRDAFCALNTAFAEDGAFIRVGRGTLLEESIHLLFVSTASEGPTMVHPRNLLIFEPESQAAVVEEYVSLGGGTVFCNSATELIAGESATVSHYMIECEDRETFNISTLRIQQDRSSNVASHSLLLGGGLVRNNVHPVLAGEGAECLINGLFVGDARQHLDNYMYVEHASPHCSSRQFYNGILDGHAHGVFHGRIVVHKDAQRTDAKQTNRNLLLSDDAQIDSKPQLEIYADDVKCTHGATIGQIEENALFYLQSRGIDRVSARKLLLLAFARECLERMKPGRAHARAEHLVHERLLSVAHDLPGEAQRGS